MKIAIITLPLHVNYGGILQAYALQTVLRRMGHEVECLEPFPLYWHHPLLRPLVWMKRGFRRFIKGEDIGIFKSPTLRVWQYTETFICENVHRKFVRNWNARLANRYDVIVVGSDQIWRPMYCTRLGVGHAFGDFTVGSRVRCVAYAVSFGTDEKEYTQKLLEVCRPLARRFRAISVREDSGIRLCKEYFGVDAVQMPDPTLLLSLSDYETFLKDAPESPGSMMTYILDGNEQISAFIRRLSQEKGLKPFEASPKEGYGKMPGVLAPVEQWLRSFHDTEFVVTDSFHGCVFSILFHKPFFCFGNMNRGMARFHSLLSMFGLEDRLIDIHRTAEVCCRDIDWGHVDSVLRQKRTEADEFLRCTLMPFPHTFYS